MTSVRDLVEKQRETDKAEPEEEVEPPTSRIHALIERQREKIEKRWEALEVTLADEIVEVEIGMIPGGRWVKIADRHPATDPADAGLGWNRDTLPRDYPADRIKLRGEHPTEDLWQDVYDLLDADDRKNVAAVVWWLNWGEPQQQRDDLLSER